MTKIYSVFRDGQINLKTNHKAKDIEMYTSANKAQALKYLQQISIKDFQLLLHEKSFIKYMIFNHKCERYELPFEHADVFSRYSLHTDEQK